MPTVTLWEVTRLLSIAVSDPYEVVVPYSTCDVDASLVVHEMVAALLVTFDDATAEVAGAVVSTTIVSLKAADQLPRASMNWT